MKRLVPLLFVLMIMVVPIFAQNPSVETTAEVWRITKNEVKAVQAELRRRGYYRAKATGYLDQNTRESIRRYQQESGLNVDGRIDESTYKSLNLTYPALGAAIDNERRPGFIPGIGYKTKDATVATGKAVATVVTTIGHGAKTGVKKTGSLFSSTGSKSKDAATDLGDASKRGARRVGKASGSVGNKVLGRSDEDIQIDVRDLLSKDTETEKWYSDVKNGRVKLKHPPNTYADVGKIISDVRKIQGVKAVTVNEK